MTLLIAIGSHGRLVAASESSAAPAPSAKNLEIRKSDPRVASQSVAAELQKRAAAVEAAKRSGDPAAVSRASGSLIAVALRQMAHLRLEEGALPAAIDLYQKSLSQQESPATRVDLAIACLRAKKAAEAVAEASKATQANPGDPRAWRVEGLAYMQKQEYGLCADALRQAAKLDDDLEVTYALGICLLDNKQKAEAEAVFKRMDTEAANRGALHVLIARAYRDAGSLPDAIRELKIALDINPNTPHAHYLLGLVYLLQEEWAPLPKIREQFLSELQINPNDFLSTYLLGSMASNEKKFEEADEYLKKATKLNPAWPEPWIYLGLNANSEGNTKSAEEFLRKGIELTGTDYSRSNYFVRKACFMLGRILVQGKEKEEGRRYLQKAKELEQQVQKDNLIAGVPGGGGMGSAGEAYASAADIKKEEDRSEPELPEGDPTAELDAAALSRANMTDAEKSAALAQEKQLRTILGASYNDLATSEAIRQQYETALEDYREAERWDAKSPGLMRNLGITAARAQKYDEAARVLPQVLDAEPNDPTVRAILGMSYYMADGYKQAAQTLAPLGEAAYKDPGVAHAWADSLIQLGELQQASEILDKLEKAPLSTERRMMVGQSWERAGNHLRAVAAFHKVLEEAPQQPKAHYYAGMAYIHADRPAEAASEFKEELAIDGNDTDAQYNLGFVSLQLSQPAEAEKLFRSVVAARPEHADAQYELGKLLLGNGHVKEAITHLEAAARLKPGADYMHYQLQAAYRRDSRIEDADRELAIYKEVKARKREQPPAKPN